MVSVGNPVLLTAFVADEEFCSFTEQRQDHSGGQR
jgi:hypothetical protein